MSNLTNDKLTKLRDLETQGGFWYITKQNLVFRDLCFMAKILETWNDRTDESYESFFNNHKTKPEYGGFDALTAHRATKNCEYIGLLYASANAKYSATNLTPFYFTLKDMCGGDFNKLSQLSSVVDKQLERMFIDSTSNSVYSVSFKINPFMFLFKILLILGDVTKKYQISISEFKLFVATAQTWNEYFEVVESILRYRTDTVYQKQCDANKSKTADVRYNVLAQNHSQLIVEGSNIAIKDECVNAVRKKVAEYELSNKIESANDMNEVDSSFQHSLDLKDTSLQPYLAAMRTKPFLLLAGISGTGKSRIVRKMAQACWALDSDERNAQVPSNFCMVQVKPNWHDSSELIGYVSRVSGKSEYIAGDFLRFVANAWENWLSDDPKPYFLCLDEMNLAPIEQYFAEFLSVLESRKYHENGYITSDPILKKDKDDWYRILTATLTADDNLRDQFLDEGICLPPNLIVVGTVNMDETTFSFSRKVLDRAMVIEMNEVDIWSGLTKGDDEWENIQLGLYDVIPTYVEAQDFYGLTETDLSDVVQWIENINSKLDGTPFKIAYRTRNEILLYVLNRQTEDFDAQQAFDEAINMKVLSRIEGDKNKVVDRNGNALLPILIKEVAENIGIDGDITDSEIEESNSPSLEKLLEMRKKLDKQFYCTYWN